MKTIPFPEELRRLWPNILEAAEQIGGWAEGYSHGYIDADEAAGDMPKEPPAEVPVYDDESWPDDREEAIAVKSSPYASMREAGDTGASMPDHLQGIEYPQFNFGTYSVFRVSREIYAAMNVGYEDTAGTDNERVVEDGDHLVVVYMA